MLLRAPLTSGPGASGSTWKGLWKLWHGPLRGGSKGEWKLQPSECNCLALSLPNTLRAYKHQRREKDLISKDIKFSELCDLWENKVSWENDFPKLKRSLQERGHQNSCESACPILLDSGPREEPRSPDCISPGLEWGLRGARSGHFSSETINDVRQTKKLRWGVLSAWVSSSLTCFAPRLGLSILLKTLAQGDSEKSHRKLCCCPASVSVYGEHQILASHVRTRVGKY